METVDVAIIGGGPAGASLAIALADGGRSGRSVAVIERSGYDVARIGETLPPEARVPLAQLGVWDRFLDQGHTPSPRTSAAWGHEALEENLFIFNPYGNGWHLDRQRFDAMLASAASDAGAAVHRRARLTSCTLAAPGHWRVAYVCENRPCQLQARFLVDATGRACIVSRRQGAVRRRHDCLTAIVGLFDGCQDEPEYGTLIEASADGWWYSAWLPHGRLVVAFMTDADLLPRAQSRLRPFWLRELASTLHTRVRTARLARNEIERPLQWLAAASELLERSGGHGWLAVGDAALSFDPLSSQGIHKALHSGLLAAATIEAVLRGATGREREWSLTNTESFDRYLRTRRSYYGIARRWPEAPFWRRRQ
ncbi:MAG: FAD-dependent monooxygenase [Vicinamibacterales bacterium]